MANNLKCFFDPNRIAIIGASSKPGKIGFELVRNLSLSKFQGEIIPINPNSPSVMNIKTHGSIVDIKDDVDLAVIAIPADGVPKALEECAFLLTIAWPETMTADEA